MDLAADLRLFYQQPFGCEVTHRPAAGGPPATGLAILDQPGAAIFAGSVIATDLSLRYPAATFPNVQKGDRLTIAGVDYVARESAQPMTDGMENTVTLAKS